MARNTSAPPPLVTTPAMPIHHSNAGVNLQRTTARIRTSERALMFALRCVIAARATVWQLAALQAAQS
jgi:hypothetical protein